MKAKHKIPTIEMLMKHLADETEPVSVAKLYALSNLEREDLACVQAGWLKIPDERRRVALRHLVDIAETNFEVYFDAIFRLGLTDPDSQVRQSAVEGLWEEEDPALINTLVTMMQADPSEQVRAAAASGLGQFVYLGEVESISRDKVEPALQALRAVIATPDEPLHVRRRAVESLGYSSDDDVSGIIHDAYNSPDELMRISAVFAMGNSADEQWIDTIISELEAQSPAMRFEAARAAGELEARSAVPTLARLLDDPDREVQEMTVWALGQIGGDRARALLSDLVKSDDAALAEAAADALEELDWTASLGRDLPLFVYDPTADEDDA